MALGKSFQDTRTVWLSWVLLVLAYSTYGQQLHGTGAEQTVWLASIGFAVVKASLFTLLWRPARRFVLLGFQSDAGYSIMVLVLASLAVLVVVQFRTFAYIVVLVAAAILVRVDCLIQRLDDRQTFLMLLVLPLLGLGLTWVPRLLFAANAVGE